MTQHRERTVTGTVSGHTYIIPEMWLAGFCRANHCTAEAALRWWHDQEMMDTESESL